MAYTEKAMPVGGLTEEKLGLATATEADVLSGKTFYSGDKTLKTGTRLKPEDQGWNVATGGTSCSITVTNGAYYDIVASYYQDTYTISRTFNITGCTTISSKGDTEISSNNYLKNYARSYVVKAASTKITFSYNTYAGNGRLVVHYKRIA